MRRTNTGRTAELIVYRQNRSMIYVGGVPVTVDDSTQDDDALAVLMKHPLLVSVSHSFRAISERKFSASDESNMERSTSKAVYVFQREFATVDPSCVDLVGTDEATTCLGIVIRNRRNRMTSVAHMDSPDVVDIGLTQMLSLAVKRETDDVFDVETSTGSINPASFDKTSRCPDEIVRRIRLTASFEDPSCIGRLLKTYDTLTDQIIISPFSWTRRQISVAFMLRNLSDSEILLSCSTSPSAEGPDFVENQRRYSKLSAIIGV
uniref:Protein N-terminal asparagine amidohydrolase n=1 Tax=Daucus carota subsp. sativus TaxID=79200 RepID=A0A175YFF0_DAUCS